jgi:hypothetical protein
MDQLTALTAVIVSFVTGFGLFGLAALRWGVDSRPSISDDHVR